ncbi:MAG: ABC transporter substrate-binding protein, partial [Acidimicrobiia bacterium]
MRFKRLFLLMSVLALIAASCGGDSDDNTTAAPAGGGDTTEAPMDDVPSSPDDGVTDDTIKIGFMGDITGPTSSTQLFFEAGIRAYTEFVNDNGGVAGRNLELFSEDDQYSSDEATLNYTKLVGDERVLAVVGQGGSSIITNLSQQIQDDQIPFIGPQQTIDAQFANPYIWSNIAHYGDQADIAIEAMSTDVGGAANLVVASVGLEVASGEEWAAYIEDTAVKAGGTYAEHIRLPLTGADADPQVVRLQELVDSQGVNYIALHGSPGAALRLLGSMDKAGLDLPIGGIFAVIAENVYQEGPADLLDTYWGVHTYTPPNISTPGNDEMNAWLDANCKFADVRNNVNFVGGWVVTKLAVEGIRVAADTGTLTRASLNTAMGTISSFSTGGQSPDFDCTRDGRACGAAGRPYDYNGTEVVARGEFAD